MKLNKRNNNNNSKTKIDDIKDEEKVYINVLEYIKKYERFILKIAYSVHRKCDRIDVEDIKQQIILRLLICAKKYDKNKDKSNTKYFSQIAVNCANTIIRTYWQTKNKANVDCVSLDATVLQDEESEFIDLIKDDKNSIFNPETYLVKTLIEENLFMIQEGLSPFEKKVLTSYINGEDIKTIAKKYKKSKKTIYNALKSIREKIKNFM